MLQHGTVCVSPGRAGAQAPGRRGGRAAGLAESRDSPGRPAESARRRLRLTSPRVCRARRGVRRLRGLPYVLKQNAVLTGLAVHDTFGRGAVRVSRDTYKRR